MDRDSSHALTPAEAKARLRGAAQDLSLAAWMRGKPWRVLGVALAGGFIFGRMRVPAASGALMMQRIAPMLLMAVLRRRGKSSA